MIFVFVATVHGYAAAWLAVRMLFRPRHPVRFLGFTVWPQGMIPRHRQRLAETIGRAVGTELVSQETLTNALFETDFFRRKVESLVAAHTAELLGTAYPSLLELLPAAARAPVLDAVSRLQYHVAEYIGEVLRSEATSTVVHSFVDERVDELLARRLDEIVDASRLGYTANFANFIEQRFSDLTGEPVFEAKVRDLLSAWLDDLLHSRTTLAEILAPETVAVIKDQISSRVPLIIDQLADVITGRRARHEVGLMIKREVDEYHAHLSLLKRMLVSRERLHTEVDALVNETLPERIEEYVRGEEFQLEAQSFLEQTIDNLLMKPVDEIIGQLPADKLELLRDLVLGRLLLLARSPELAATLSTYARDALERLRPQTLRALLHQVEPDSAKRIKEFLAETMLGVLTREETLRAVNQMISHEIERLLLTPLGRPTDYMPAEAIEQASTALTERITLATRERLPAAITEFDIGGIVRRKVGDYPEEKLEELVLSVAQQHLRTIEVFGLVIGFVIGVVQAGLQLVVLPWWRAGG